jgi:hypothetical protein
MSPTKVRFIWPAVSEENFFLKLANQKQELPVAAVFVNGSELNEHLYRGPILKKNSPLKPLAK